MKIIIWDDDEPRCLAHRDVFESASKKLGLRCDIAYWCRELAPTEESDFSSDYDLLLLHGSNRDEAFPWFTSKGKVPSLVLEYGGGGVSTGIRRGVSPSNPIVESEAAGILKAAGNAADQDGFLASLATIWSAPQHVLSWALLDAYGGSCDAVIKFKGELEEEALAELRRWSNEPTAELSRESAKALIGELRHDW